VTELSAFAEFISHYGWLGVTVLVVAAFLTGIIHSDNEFKREVVRGDRAMQLASDVTDQFERGLDLIEKMQSRRRLGDR